MSIPIRHVLIVMYLGFFVGLSNDLGVASSYVDEPEVHLPTTYSYRREDLTFLMGKSNAHTRFKRYVYEDKASDHSITNHMISCFRETNTHNKKQV